MVTNMFSKGLNKRLCLFYILILLLWGALPCAVSASEISGIVCNSEECYVNHGSATISPITKNFPAGEYLSARELGPQETMSAARSRSIRPVSRSIKHFSMHLFSGSPLTSTHSIFRHFLQRKTVSHCLCSIIITNYIHHQDGQKS